MAAIRKTISISEAEEKYITDNHVSLSKVIHDSLDTKMNGNSHILTPTQPTTWKAISFLGLVCLMMGLLVPSIVRGTSPGVWGLFTVLGGYLVWWGYHEYNKRRE